MTCGGELLTAWNERPRVVQNQMMDSTRWNELELRDSDIVVATWAKSGTTWVQQILGQLIFRGEAGVAVMEVSPWIEQCCYPRATMLEQLASQGHRRFFKSHLPIDALPFSPRLKYIYVGRDGRDVIWSWYNHHKRLTRYAYDIMNAAPERTGPPFGPPTKDFREFFLEWLERDGHPLWPFWSHVQSWWSVRERSNVMLVHFRELKADLEGQIERIARFLGIAVDRAAWARILRHSTFEYMKAHAAELSSELEPSFVGGARTFISRGTSGAWREELSPRELAAYESAVRANLTEDCAFWLATGEQAGRAWSSQRDPAGAAEGRAASERGEAGTALRAEM